MGDKYYNILEKQYKENMKDLGTYYVLYDDKFNFLQKFQKADLPKILTKYRIKYNNLKFQQ